MARLAITIVLTKKLPFKTPHDVYRWCLAYGIEHLCRLSDDKEVQSDWSQIESILRIGAQEIENLEYEDGIRVTLERIRRLFKAGHEEKARQIADLLWKRGDAMEDPHWRQIYRDRAKRVKDEMRRRVEITIDDIGRKAERIKGIGGSDTVRVRTQVEELKD